MKKKLYLHIGLEKTGTTTTQYALGKSYTSLKEQGILYPKTMMDKWFNHIGVVNYCLSDEKFQAIRTVYGIKDRDSLRKFRKNVEEEFSNELSLFDGNTVIMSNEHCSSRLITIKEIENVRKFFTKYFDEIYIIAYIREQVSYLLSSYSTSVRFSNTKEIFSPKQFQNKRDIFDYDVILKRWENVFGKENIILRIFDRNELIDSDIVSDFTKILNIRLPKEYKLELNKSLNVKQIEFLRMFNKHINFINDNGKINLIRKGVIQIVERNLKDGASIRTLINKDYIGLYDNSNENVRKRYFPERETLFQKFNLTEDSLSTNKKKINVEEVVELFCKILKEKET